MVGRVDIVGAGPGAAELITIKGLEKIREAEVLIYDRLVGFELIEEASATCELIYVGKNAHQHTMEQSQINQLLVEKAEEGKRVVRLKGGDPYVFGRGGEEVAQLQERQIPFEVVPGITSSIAGLTYAGIPITHRDYASSFHIFTGHLKEDGKAYDWSALARLEGTLVFLMGIKNLEKITHQLITHGLAGDTPVALIHWATYPHQQILEATLATVIASVQETEITSPSIIVIGKVVALRKQLTPINQALKHQRILVTRASKQKSTLIRKIREQGGIAFSLPMIQIEPIPPEVQLKKMLSNYTYLIFTSVNGVERFLQELMGTGLDIRALSHLKIASIGTGTSDCLNRHGIQPDIQPERFVAESLLAYLLPRLKATDQILLPCAKETRKMLATKLREKVSVTELVLYQTLKPEMRKEFSLEKVDAITFTSASTVRNFVEYFKENLEQIKGKKIISIGPITSAELRKHGLEVTGEAKPYTLDGIVNVLLETVQFN